MQNRKHEIRHSNARKILVSQCDGSIKQFSILLKKKEQQCSNFLRENNPVNIGDSIARQIESTFGYPTGWLDHRISGAESITNADNFKTITLFAELNKVIERIGISAYNCRNDVASLITYNNTLNAVHNLKRISSSVKSDMLATALQYVAELVGDILQEPAYIEDDIQGVICGHYGFIQYREDVSPAQKTVRNLHVFRSHTNLKRVYKFAPTIIDGAYHVFIIRYLDSAEDGLYVKQGQQAAALKHLKSMSDVNIQKSDIPEILLPCLDGNPDFT